jgi:hypothetical protein
MIFALGGTKSVLSYPRLASSYILNSQPITVSQTFRRHPLPAQPRPDKMDLRLPPSTPPACSTSHCRSDLVSQSMLGYSSGKRGIFVPNLVTVSRHRPPQRFWWSLQPCSFLGHGTCRGTHSYSGNSPNHLANPRWYRRCRYYSSGASRYSECQDNSRWRYQRRSGSFPGDVLDILAHVGHVGLFEAVKHNSQANSNWLFVAVSCLLLKSTKRHSWLPSASDFPCSLLRWLESITLVDP